MSNSKRKIVRKTLKKVATKVVELAKGRKRDYIVRIHVGSLHSVAVLRLQAKSRKDAVELTKAAIEITGEVAPVDLPNNTSLERTNMDEEIVETPAVEAEVPAEEAVESAE